ncbi:hypothetical protein RJ639_024906 [Escallonia herrerae]|uniref:Cytochrome P450 n=1 Tax=Escallonia herrerae TaxID=1293975 RepID=A0AA88UYB5_9ASTE|nr:hypothetical protein RJ639_024906 [Escallonia herrerae]
MLLLSEHEQTITSIMELLGFMLCSLLFLLAIHCLSLFRRRTLPPGPYGLPLVGNLFQIGPKPHESLAKLAKKHGPLMTIRLGSVTSVVASSPAMAREILQKNDEACSGRPIPDAVTALDEYNHAVLWMPAGAEWRIIRRALNTYLTHPQKLDTLRGLRHTAVEELIQHVKEASQREEAVDIGKLAFTTALNQMSNTCVSENVADFTSKEIRGFQNAVKTLMEVDGKFNIADIFPWLKPLDPQRIRSKAEAAYSWLDAVSDDFIRRRLKRRQSKMPRYGDLLDSLLDFSQENEAEFNCKHIKILLVDLFLAGTETSSNTTEWAMTELLLNPSIMAKLRQEVSDNVGAKGKIEESEILELPYLQAVVKETMRLHLSVPFLVPHKTETSVTLKGYAVPPNTQILVNAWAIARDAEHWENPMHFMPERFLKSEVDFKGQHFSFLPFGSGRRMCPGIPLAQRVVSLMIASLVYHFDWKLPHSTNELDMNDIFGITLLRATPLLAVPMNFREGITGRTM